MTYELPAQGGPAVLRLRRGTVVEVNEVANALLGGGEVLGARFTSLVHEDDRVRAELVELLDGGAEGPAGHAGHAGQVLRLVGEPARWVELVAGWVVPAGSRGDAAYASSTAFVLRDATEQVRVRRIARELITSASVVGDHGQRLWGPIGRELPLDGTELPGSVVDRIHPEDLGRVLDLYTQILASPGLHLSAEIRIQDPGLEGRWTDARIQINDCRAVPEIAGMLVSTDHLPNDGESSSIGHTDSSLLSIAEAAPVGIILTGPSGQGAYFNAAVQRLLPGVGPGGLDRDWTSHACDAERAGLQAALAQVRVTREPDSRVVCFVPPDADRRWLLVTIAPRIVEADRLIGLVVTLQDVSAEVVVRQQLEAAQERLVHLATHDDLTGLANRALLTDELQRRLSTSVPVGLLFCDLDGFKAVNDQLGHAVGDTLLAEVAARLSRVVRADDTLARFGGDEFIIVSTEVDDLEGLATRAIDAVREPYLIDGHDLRVGMSVGLSVATSGEAADELLRRADEAMYAAKAGGGSVVHEVPQP